MSEGEVTYFFSILSVSSNGEGWYLIYYLPRREEEENSAEEKEEGRKISSDENISYEETIVKRKVKA